MEILELLTCGVSFKEFSGVSSTCQFPHFSFEAPRLGRELQHRFQRGCTCSPREGAEDWSPTGCPLFLPASPSSLSPDLAAPRHPPLPPHGHWSCLSQLGPEEWLSRGRFPCAMPLAILTARSPGETASRADHGFTSPVPGRSASWSQAVQPRSCRMLPKGCLDQPDFLVF